MDKFEKNQARHLRYRTHYRVYFLFFLSVSLLILSFWGYLLFHGPWQIVLGQHLIELTVSGCYLLAFGTSYFFWLRSRLTQSVQVFPGHLLVHNGRCVREIKFEDIESVTVVCLSLFYLKMKDGYKHYFSSSLERVDYIWEGIKAARPEIIGGKEYEKFRVNLVQYDHHQKRKEWFFRHKFVDIINWVFLPAAFCVFAYIIQSKDVLIYQQGLYFFRLFMYSLLVLLSTAFIFSLMLKKWLFDRKVEAQIEAEPSHKLRDLEFEGIVLQRSKVFQMITASVIFSIIIKIDLNLYSVTKMKLSSTSFNLKPGKTLVIDNRFNCFECKYKVSDGDVVVFGRGLIGQVLAREGELVGEVGQDDSGRMIASENVQEVPVGHLAVKAPNGKDIIFIKIGDMIGKIQN